MELTRTKFKQTEIGLIPEDWEVLKLKETLAENPKYGIGAAATDFNLNLPTYLRITDIEEDGTLRKNDLKSVDHQDSGNYFLKNGDIVFARTGASVGKSYLYDTKDGFLVYAGFLIKVSPNNSILNSQFLKAFVSTKTYWNWVTVMSMRSGQPGINSIEFGSLQIPLPPLSEQKAIAQVLSDTDNLIHAIEQKLTKKRAIKQGAMQQLLTPKENWEVKKLPEVCWFQEGPGLRNWQFTEKGMKVINVTNLVNGYLNLDKTDRHISMNEFEKMYKHFEIDENDIVMASSGNSYSKVAGVRKQDLRLLMNTSVIRFKPLDGLDYNYLLIFLKSKIFKDQIDLLITGGAQPNFGPFHLKKIDIAIPSTMEEQIHISTILSDMEIEIEQIEEQLSKYKLLKQGLMQNLLTGKIRLV